MSNDTTVLAAEDDDQEYDCDICDNPEDCGNCEGSGDDGFGDCMRCGGDGEVVPGHCCACGGSPYCDCCRKCGKCVAECACPIEVKMQDGSSQVIGPAQAGDHQ